MEHLEVVDLADILDGLENKWVVLSKDNKTVLAVAESLEGLGEVRHKGRIFRVPDPNYAYSPSSLNF